MCQCSATTACACQTRDQLERVDTTRAVGGAYTCGAVEIPKRHNRYRIAVAVDAGVTAGDVAVDVQIEDPRAPGTWRSSKVGTIAWSADGGQLVGQLAPVGKARIAARVTGYVGGAGLWLRIFHESWREAM